MSSHSLRSLAMFGALFVAAITLPSSLRAQQDATADRAITTNGSTIATRALPDSTVRTLSGPRVAQAAVTGREAHRALAAESQNRDNNIGVGSNVALMGVGAAGVVIGLLVGGDGGAAIAIGGGALGLFGLYRYLR